MSKYIVYYVYDTVCLILYKGNDIALANAFLRISFPDSLLLLR